MHLYPLEKENEKVPRYAVCDIESAHWTKFLVIGYYDGEKFQYFKKLMKFFAYLIAKNENQTIYAHFGGNFDFLFLLGELLILPGVKVENMIPRGSGILSFDVFFEGEKGEELKLTFSDSSAFLPFGLASLCENFKVKHQKGSIDHTKTKHLNRKIAKYLKHDCLGLYEVIEKYFEWDLIKRAGPKSTMASQALQVLRLFLEKPLFSLKDNPSDFVRPCYFGGRTEIFKPLYRGEKGESIHCYDVNSLYPTVMRENDFPNAFAGYCEKYLPDRMGFYDATVEVPESLYVPPLGIVHKVNGSEKFIFPTGRFSGRWSTIELEYARSIGVKIISTGKGAIFHNGGPFFKPFIEALYAIRMGERKKEEEGMEPNLVADIIAKLLMNSSYGRFGLNKDRENLVVDDGSLGLSSDTIEGEKYEGYVIKTALGDIRLAKQSKVLEDSFTNVAIAAWVTSLSRIYMHRIYMKVLKSLYYTDTDSLFTPARLDSSKELGGLKLEYSAKSACFLLPKTYVVDELLNVYKKVEGKKVQLMKKVVMKGFQARKIKNFTLEDFTQALEGDLKRLSIRTEPDFAKLKTALRKGKLVTMTDASHRSIQSQYDKRTIVKRDGVFDTVPLHLCQHSPSSSVPASLGIQKPRKKSGKEGVAFG